MKDLLTVAKECFSLLLKNVPLQQLSSIESLSYVDPDKAVFESLCFYLAVKADGRKGRRAYIMTADSKNKKKRKSKQIMLEEVDERTKAWAYLAFALIKREDIVKDTRLWKHFGLTAPAKDILQDVNALSDFIHGGKKANELKITDFGEIVRNYKEQLKEEHI